ncbi:CesT family type III secretion system chaperone [Chlamydiia bacterium]|jgi:hypothetical protein|nr:CesT family type III secretion system chaperone [Chlamydiia bacterium]
MNAYLQDYAYEYAQKHNVDLTPDNNGGFRLVVDDIKIDIEKMSTQTRILFYVEIGQIPLSTFNQFVDMALAWNATSMPLIGSFSWHKETDALILNHTLHMADMKSVSFEFIIETLVKKANVWIEAIFMGSAPTLPNEQYIERQKSRTNIFGLDIL